MICESDISTISGQLLIPANSPIEKKHLRLFKAWGITEVPILEESTDGVLEASNQLNAIANSDLERRFIFNSPSIPIVQEMKRILSTDHCIRVPGE